jgi:uncharacterized protein
MPEKKPNHVPPFTPKIWMRNPIMQNMAGAFVDFKSPIKTNELENEIITLPDNDSIEICHYAHDPTKAKPIALLLPGIQGVYLNKPLLALANELKSQWHVIIMQYRGCSDASIMEQKFPFIGDYSDLFFLYKTIQKRYENRPIAAMGTSFGGNLLLSLLAHHPETKLLCAATTSTLFCLKQSIKHWGSKFDQLLLRLYKARASKLIQTNPTFDISIDDVNSCQTVDEFLKKILYPNFGYGCEQQYHKEVNLYGKMKNIHTKTLIVHAEDDFVSPIQSLPTPEQLHPNTRIITTQYGSHSCFAYKNPWDNQFWTTQVIADFFNQQLAYYQN